MGGLIDAQANKQLLEDVRALQTKLRADDDSAAAALADFARTNVEGALSRAIAVMQLRGQKRDVSPAITVWSNVIKILNPKP